jgi:transcription-repair coupling factor (superfamily II helicase)
LGEEVPMLFPMSYKKAYQYQDIDNANVLMRAEVLSKINNNTNTGQIIVSYPEALFEKVINKRSLMKNTLTVSLNEQLDTNFLAEILLSYDFEKTDFVYEAGQFSIRGGIVDVFSFSNELPYRIDLFGNEVESIRTFDPDSQLSIESVSKINIIPDVQTKLIQETREPFFQFLSPDTRLWFKDVEHALEIVEKCFEKVEQSLQEILAKSGGIQVVSDPNQLFESRRSFLQLVKGFGSIEFGRRFYFKEKPKN